MIEEVRLGHVTALVGARSGRYPSANCVRVDDERTLMVDPSIDVVASREGIATSTVELLVNSHAHEDHFAGNFLFERAELVMHSSDAPAMASMEALIDAYGLGPEFDEEWAEVLRRDFNFRPRADITTVGEGDTLELGKGRVRFLHTPGHTAGHVCLLFEPDDVLFTGDLDMSRFGPYYADRTADLGQMIDSLARLRDLDGVRAFVTSHEAGVVREDLRGTVERFTDVLWQREEKLLEFLERPRSLDEIARAWIVYGRRYDKIPWQYHAERVMMEQHAERLAQLGVIEKLDDERYLARR